jgi:cardiolipin synthase
VKKGLNFFKQLPAHEKKLTISTCITLVRLALSPLLFLLMTHGFLKTAFWCFVIASLSDTLDGTIARWRDERTLLGACLDPLADKLLIVTCFFTLSFVDTPLFVVPHWFAWLLLTKELLLIGGVLLVYARFGYVEIQPTVASKMSTVVQLCFIGYLFAGYFFHWMPLKTYAVLLGIIIVMLCITVIQYARTGLRIIENAKQSKN